MAARSDEYKRSPLKAWLRALERTAGIERPGALTLPELIEAQARQHEQAPALVGRESLLTYRALAQSCHRYSRWGLDQGLQAGEVVCLLMHNCPEYLAIWLGLTRIGVTVALLNTQLRAEALAYSIRIVAPRYVIASAGMSAVIESARVHIAPQTRIWIHGDGEQQDARIDLVVAAMSAEPLAPAESPVPALHDRALCIYTSGTTGRPKAANVSHYRLLQWSHWFAGLMDVQPSDRMYDCLPLYHSVGGVVATGASLVSGAAVVLREQFSASAFWTDVVTERCTLFQYIGELCRYLANAPTGPDESRHGLRLACGNGLRGDVWAAFQQRFHIPQILEYYAATEGNFSLYNCEGRVGAVGRIPPYLAHRQPVEIVRFDVNASTPLRDASGRCVRCGVDEVGEVIGQIGGHGPARFEGYTDADASSAKVLRDVFVAGDSWYRTGDLMRRDPQGFFYFVDRVGDTFRWKGENVSTIEVAEVIGRCRGVRDVAVYGVTLPGADGRAGMAALVIDDEFNLELFCRALESGLPAYARPVLLRATAAIHLTGTYKLNKQRLLQDGFDPARSCDALYVKHAAEQGYVRLDETLYSRLQGGTLRL